MKDECKNSSIADENIENKLVEISVDEGEITEINDVNDIIIDNHNNNNISRGFENKRCRECKNRKCFGQFWFISWWNFR